MANIKYQPLGGRAFLAMLLEKIPFLIILALIIFIINYYGANFLPAIFLNIIPIPWWPFWIVIGITLLATYMQYVNYGVETFASGINFFHGLIFQTQIGMPFNKIKEVTITKTLGGHFLGINTVFITLIGLGDEEPNLTEKVISIAYLNDTIAHAIQDAILGYNSSLRLHTCLKN
jgi:energy-coupling factor transporter transmembrane protein EcfT